MKLSRKICDCAQSPIRKFYPYAVAAQQRGIRIHQLNIGQPDIQTPPAFFEAIEAGRRDVLAYAESPGIPVLIEAIRAYYARIGASFETQDILVTTGGSEALLMAMLCILDEGDEVLIPEPYYPNYFTFIRMAGGRVHPIPTSPEDGYRYAERARVEPHITEKTRAILLSNPGNPTGTVLTPAELRLMADIAREHGLYLICDEVYREFIYDGAEPATAGSFRLEALQRLRRAHRCAHLPQPRHHAGRAEAGAGPPVRRHARSARRGCALWRGSRLLQRDA